MKRLLLASIMMLVPGRALAQSDNEPVMIKMNRVVMMPDSKYSFYIPTFEFEMYFQKQFEFMRSAVTADYDYRRQDMGFGMSHVLTRWLVNPGVNVDDNLYFRQVFSDSTGIWRRKQSVTPFILHEIDEHNTIALEFKFEREWSPSRTKGSDVIQSLDRSIKFYFFRRVQDPVKELSYYLFYTGFERSYKILKGMHNYFIYEMLFRLSRDFTDMTRYKGTMTFRGDITPQVSPLFFIGGRTTLVGYDNDELWGRRSFSFQNMLEFKPVPDFTINYKRLKMRRFSIIYEVDFGKVSGASQLPGFRRQTSNMKIGTGVGIGFNTDLPYMPQTDVYMLFAAPSENTGDIKYYAGFGGWID